MDGYGSSITYLEKSVKDLNQKKGGITLNFNSWKQHNSKLNVKTNPVELVSN